MIFNTPSGTAFEISDDWWRFAEMPAFSASSGGYFPYAIQYERVQVISCSLVDPPRRADGIPAFKKYKMVPLLFAFQAPECALPPIAVVEIQGGVFPYRVVNGYHRYYASIAAGYHRIPAIVQAASVD